MAQTFPMALADFFAGLPIQSSVPTLGEAMEFSQTGAGEVLTVDLGARLWMMDVSIRLGSYAEIERIKARLDLLRSAGRSLLVHSIPLLAPQYDPTGAILGASDVRLASVASNNREMSITGLPAGYKLTAGDFISFQYRTDPVRYAMHQFASDATANGSGVISSVEVSNFIRPGAVANTQLQLIKPRYKAVVVPGSTKAPTIGQMKSEGLSFSLIQTLR